jgi:hypothetical protein
MLLTMTVVAGLASATVQREPAQTLNLSPAEREAIRTDDTGLVETRSANGTKTVDLQGRFQMLVTMKVDANGKRTFQCNDPEHHHADGEAFHDQQSFKAEER